MRDSLGEIFVQSFLREAVVSDGDHKKKSAVCVLGFVACKLFQRRHRLASCDVQSPCGFCTTLGILVMFITEYNIPKIIG